MAGTDEQAKAWIATLVDTSAATATIIESQRDFIRLLTERVGELVMELERVLPDSEDVARYGDDMRQWLLLVKGLEANVNEVLEGLKDTELLRRIL